MMRIAVVGSGISGLAAAWLLSQRHAVTLFEAQPRLGGHTNTIDVTLDGVTWPVDTGFLVFNEDTYENLVPMLRHLDVPVAASDMSFSLALEEPHVEWAGTSLATLFAQPRNLLRPGFLRMLRDIARFNREASACAADDARQAAHDASLGAFLAANGYSDEFRDWYLLPMAAAIWSCPTATMLEYPFRVFARFFHNHGLLRVTGRPQWFTVRGGARQYIERIAPLLTDVRLASPVVAVRRDAAGVTVTSEQRIPVMRERTERFDALVLATHSNQALALLGAQASADEREVLAAIPYQHNRALLHTDASLLPSRRSIWSAWNYTAGREGTDGRPVAVHYLINKLQPLPFAQPVIVSLNPHREPDARSVIAEIDYEHPVFDARAPDAQLRLATIQGDHRTWFCGAWTRYGFHEDGLRSAVAVANAFGIEAPWQKSSAGRPLELERRAA